MKSGYVPEFGRAQAVSLARSTANQLTLALLNSPRGDCRSTAGSRLTAAERPRLLVHHIAA